MRSIGEDARMWEQWIGREVMALCKIAIYALILAFVIGERASSAGEDAAFNQPMQFAVAGGPVGNLGGSGTPVWIDAIGTIDVDTPARFQAFLESGHASGRERIELNSPGGNLSAGLKLGRMIREQKMITDVNGICASAWV